MPDWIVRSRLYRARQNELKDGAQRSIGRQYYYIDYQNFCNVVKWRVTEMRRIIDSTLRKVRTFASPSRRLSPMLYRNSTIRDMFARIARPPSHRWRPIVLWIFREARLSVTNVRRLQADHTRSY